MARKSKKTTPKSAIPTDERRIYDLCAEFAVVAIDLISQDAELSQQEAADVQHIKHLCTVWLRSDQGHLEQGASIVQVVDDIVSGWVNDRDAMQAILPYVPNAFKERKLGDIFDNSGAYNLAAFCYCAEEMTTRPLGNHPPARTTDRPTPLQ